MLVNTKAKIGVFSIALGAYLPQFPQLVPNFEAQYEDFKKTIPDTVEIIDGGMVTTKEQAMAAGSTTFYIPLNRQQLADYLSVDRSALSAELSRLQAEGKLRFHRSQFTLLASAEG